MPLENPYRHGAYHFTIQTLIQMGINKAHRFSNFAAKLQRVWQKTDPEGFKGFKNREARNEATAKDLDGRIMQNCRVLQRVKDYGKPLLKAGAVLDLIRDKGGVLQIYLNTKSKKPQKPGRAPKPEAKPAKSKPKATRKPSKGRKGAQKRTVRAPATNRSGPAVEDTVKASVTEESAKAG